MTTPGLHPALEPLDSLDWERLDAFLLQGLSEDERLDYKDRVSPSITETIAAMANGPGGTIIVGVREGATPSVPGTWDGAPGDLAEAVRNSVWSYCQPAPILRSGAVSNPRTGLSLLVVAVAPSAQPPIWHRDRGIVVRTGDQSRPARPEVLEAWYRARQLGNPSERALRSGANAAGAYGPAGFILAVWPTGVVPRSYFGPESDGAIDAIARITLEPDGWTGAPQQNRYELSAERPDRWMTAAVGEEAYVRCTYFSRPPDGMTTSQLVTTARDMTREYARRLVFADLALREACGAHPPYRVELALTYGSSWRLAVPPSDMDYSDPVVPVTAEHIDHPALIETSMAEGDAVGATRELLTGTLRRLHWRQYESFVQHLVSGLPEAIELLHRRAAA